MLKNSLVIFDLDGTLIDSAPDIVATTNLLLKSRGRPELAEATIVAAIGEGLKALIWSCFPEAQTNPSELAAIDKEFYAVYKENLCVRTKVFDGIHELLETAPHRIGIVTNKYLDLTLLTLEHLRLDRHAWVKVFGADSFSERKPHPRPLLEMMREANVAPERTLMVGDGLPDMRAARAAGVRAIACGYGYCAAEKLLAAGAHTVVASPSELTGTIATLLGTPGR